MNKKLSTKDKWLQPGIGLLIITLIIVPVAIYKLVFDTNNGVNVVGMTATGCFLGYALSRGNMGFAGPIKKMVQNGDGRQAKALILLFVICSIFAGAGMIVFSGAKVFGYPMTVPLGIGTISGGLIFGVGMTLATGCASGTLSDMGDGIVPAVLVLLFFMLGSSAGVGFYFTSADKSFLPEGADTSIATNVHSVSLGIFINVVMLLSVLFVVSVLHKWRAKRKTQLLWKFQDDEFSGKYAKLTDLDIETDVPFFSYKTWRRLMAKRWPWGLAVLSLVLWYAIIMLGFKETPGITGAYAHWGITITHGWGNNDIIHWNDGWNVMDDTQSWQNFGIVAGAASAKLFANKFKLVDWQGQKWYNWALFAVGGFMMGVGARMARGCNFGALFTGVTFGTGFGWVFTIFLVTGATGASFFNKWIHHNTPKEIYKIKKPKK